MDTPKDDITARLELALSAAREAGRLTLDYFQRSDLAVDRKSDGSPVTIADREAERLLRQRIVAAFPEDGILGEELPEKKGSSEYRWILDPVDGTKSFISGVPLFANLVAVVRQGRGLVGVINLPGLAECTYAAQGQGAWNLRGDGSPVRARVSPLQKLADGLFVTSQIDGFAERGARQTFHRLERAAGITRTWGDAYGYVLVATGRAVAMVDPIVCVWDVAAAQPIVEEAGGSFSDFGGKATLSSGEAVATNGHVRDEVLAITRGFLRKEA